MESLRDPASLRERPAVDYRTETHVDDPDDFEYFASIAGLAAVGVTSESGAVLLMDSPHGWRLPYGPVADGEDWVAAAERIAADLTDVDAAVDRATRATELTRRLAGDDARETTSFDVVLPTVPVTGEPIASAPGFDPWGALDVAWFDAVPDDAYWDHGDAVDDIRAVLP